jgi:hypothetical protein
VNGTERNGNMSGVHGRGKMRKTRKKKFEKGTEARRVARKSGIIPANTRVIEDKRKRPPKHKKKWLEKEVVEVLP